MLTPLLLASPRTDVYQLTGMLAAMFVVALLVVAGGRRWAKVASARNWTRHAGLRRGRKLGGDDYQDGGDWYAAAIRGDDPRPDDE